MSRQVRIHRVSETVSVLVSATMNLVALINSHVARMSHVAHMNLVAYMDESRRTFEGVMSHQVRNDIVSERVWALVSATMNLVALINSHVAPMSHVAHVNHVAHINESRRTYE